MGMFDKDKEYGRRLDVVVAEGEPFLLLDAYLDGTIPTQLGDAVLARLAICRLQGNGQAGPVMECNTVASAIVEKVREAEPEDFPAVCELGRVQGRYGRPALVISFLSAWEGQAPAAPARRTRNGGSK